MWNVQPDKIVSMFHNMAKTHKDQMHSIYLNWDCYTISHPKYENKMQVLTPLVVIDFK